MARGEDTDSESGSESSGASSCDSGWSDEEKGVDSATTPMSAQCVCGMFIVNRLSARFHAAVLIEDGALRRACAICKDIDDLRWEVWKEDPSASAAAFEPCLHPACAKVLCGEDV